MNNSKWIRFPDVLNDWQQHTPDVLVKLVAEHEPSPLSMEGKTRDFDCWQTGVEGSLDGHLRFFKGKVGASCWIQIPFDMCLVPFNGLAVSIHDRRKGRSGVQAAYVEECCENDASECPTHGFSLT